ncbi:MAG: hypothetical protein NTX64_03295 [Elusimicrobia bacterium]|nr:hypothetical protein [Elusimicrobiota bacterium]
MIGFLATLSIGAAAAVVAGLIIKFGGPRRKASLMPGERELGAHAADLEGKVGVR